MTVLDDILDASTDPTVPTADLIRKVQIAAHRLGAQDIVDWARNELSGYPTEASIPSYRVVPASVMGLFTGPMRSQITHHLTAIPDGMADRWEARLRQPIVELQGLADAEGQENPTLQWSAYDVQRYEAAGLFRIQYHTLFDAWSTMSKQSLRGVIDVVRTRAMEFALELQTSFPDAGSVGGPTVRSTPALAQTVYNITNNITGHGTNVSAGTNGHQSSIVSTGDEKALLRSLKELGLEKADRDEFMASIKEDQSVDGPRTRTFLERVRSGTIALVAGLTTDVAAEILVSLGRSFLGGG